MSFGQLPQFRPYQDSVSLKPLSNAVGNVNRALTMRFQDDQGRLDRDQRQANSDREYNRALSVQRDRSSMDQERMKMDREQFGLKKEQTKESALAQRKAQLLGLAKRIAAEPDDNLRSRQWTTLISSDPKLSGLEPQFQDPIMGARNLLDSQMGNGGNESKVGLTPVYGRDANGNVVMMQPSSSGEMVQSRLPDGVSVDLGVSSAERARGSAIGKSEGVAQFNLPAVEEQTRKIVRSIDDLVADPHLENMTGFSGYLPNVTSDARRVQSRMDQLQGQTFLQGFEALKGGGVITDLEGQKAEESLNRLRMATQGTQDYIDAALEFRKDVVALANLARQKAQGGYGSELPPSPNFDSEAQDQGAPPPGTVDDNHVFLGGDPADPSNWRPQ